MPGLDGVPAFMAITMPPVRLEVHARVGKQIEPADVQRIRRRLPLDIACGQLRRSRFLLLPGNLRRVAPAFFLAALFAAEQTTNTARTILEVFHHQKCEHCSRRSHYEALTCHLLRNDVAAGCQPNLGAERTRDE